ncbi:hypothetical protein BOTCAL_0424g00120 [Botryotinia calthae]|uniref:BTB domain-containing protein n=1 Tax=Botryotinia calthae TaxID=38488 RepID=A0A4Y8CP80_9HELO|nr:hypothetical protein BOTCAL_0424g00120 [Botryotinia calthae]
MPRKRSHSEVSSDSSTTSEDKDYATNENPTDTSFVDSVGTDMVDIHVGRDEDKKHFRVHKKRICAYSSYFKDCFWKGRRVTRLSDETPKLFDVIIEWVYTGKLRLFKDTISHSESYSLYQLAELLVLPVAMDKIMTFIRGRHYGENFYITAGSLRAYAIELFIYTLRGDTDEDEKVITNWGLSSLLNVEGFTSDFIKLSREITIEDPRVSGCRFHVHEEHDLCGEKEHDDKPGDGKRVDEVDEDETTIDSNEEIDENEDEDEDEERIKDE